MSYTVTMELVLTCDDEEHDVALRERRELYHEREESYVDRTLAPAKKEARMDGWRFMCDGRVLCPKHSNPRTARRSPGSLEQEKKS